MKLIGICGKKSSGKTSLANDIKKYFYPQFKATIMSMATPLKDFCMDDLGLDYNQLYGTEEEKNSLTKYKWENLPNYQDIIQKITEEEELKALIEFGDQPKWCRWYEKWSGAFENNLINRIALRVPFGYMTARQIIQQWGTEIFRRVDNDYWVKKAVEAIEEDQSYNNDIRPSGVIIFDDIRFTNEADMIRDNGGILIKLMRGNNTKDSHSSEHLDYEGFDIIIPDGLNRNETLNYFIKKWE